MATVSSNHSCRWTFFMCMNFICVYPLLMCSNLYFFLQNRETCAGMNQLFRKFGRCINFFLQIAIELTSPNQSKIGPTDIAFTLQSQSIVYSRPGANENTATVQGDIYPCCKISAISEHAPWCVHQLVAVYTHLRVSTRNNYTYTYDIKRSPVEIGDERQ